VVREAVSIQGVHHQNTEQEDGSEKGVKGTSPYRGQETALEMPEPEPETYEMKMPAPSQGCMVPQAAKGGWGQGSHQGLWNRKVPLKRSRGDPTAEEEKVEDTRSREWAGGGLGPRSCGKGSWERHQVDPT
jgi:hypothetical protein